MTVLSLSQSWRFLFFCFFTAATAFLKINIIPLFFVLAPAEGCVSRGNNADFLNHIQKQIVPVPIIRLKLFHKPFFLQILKFHIVYSPKMKFPRVAFTFFKCRSDAWKRKLPKLTTLYQYYTYFGRSGVFVCIISNKTDCLSLYGERKLQLYFH